MHRLSLVPRFYRYAYRIRNWNMLIAVPADCEKQGIRIEVTGQSIKDWADGARLLKAVTDAGGRVTRVDYAFDFIREEFEFNSIIALMAARAAAAGRTHTVYGTDRPTGVTLNRRTNPLYFRCYDKALEQGRDYQWLRLELECKQELAQTLPKTPLFGFREAAGLLVNVADIADTSAGRELQRVFGDDEPKAYTSPRVAGQTERWIYQQVLPAIRRLSRENPSAAADAVNALELAYEVEQLKLFGGLDEGSPDEV
jgi:hypothetical protein